MRKRFLTLFMVSVLSGASLFSLAGGLSEQGIESQADRNEPEWLQSILLLQLSRNMTRSEANRLEADVRLHPDSIENRLRLIGFYVQKGRGSFDRLRLRNHVLWIVDNHPEHPATGEPALRDLPEDPEGNIQIRELWSKNVKEFANDDRVVRNAERYFFSKDPVEAERLIYRLHQKDAGNREWPRELEQLYLMTGVPEYASRDPAEIATEAYRRVLDITSDARARETLSGNMADVYFKAGDMGAAAALAKIFTQSPDRRAIQRANTLLGRIAVRKGDVPAAVQFLRASAKCPAMRSVPLSGPMMALAKELLEKGQREAVLEYLVDCATIWPQLQDVFRFWISTIQNGGIPDFGNTLQ